ncbi:autotransporter-associated beta strand repeat-containing protein [Christensenellaceae bacterium OttesenSCG-928-K19]|nr:autotransporter-associated beta strand repeat-containing protein [Christensenellaceae bacterium OttesenSCG-928-K19]
MKRKSYHVTKKFICILVALALVLTLLPMAALAEEAPQEPPKCVCEAQCVEDSANADCEACTEDIAVCAGKVPKPAPQPQPLKASPSQDELAVAGEITGDTLEAPVLIAAFGGIQTEYEITVGDALPLPNTLQGCDADGKEYDVPVAWNADTEYDGATGEYSYTAALDDAGFALAQDAALPTVTVNVQAAAITAQGEMQPMAKSYTLDELVAANPTSFSGTTPNYTLKQNLTLAAGDTLTIASGEALTISAGVTFTVLGNIDIQVNAPAGELTNNGTLQLGVGGVAGTITITDFVIIVNNGMVEVNNSDSSTCNAYFKGAGTLTKTGTGTLTLSGDNNFVGGIVINGGTIIAKSVLSVKTTVGGGGGSVVNNGALVFDIYLDGTYASTISGTGTLTKAGTGKLTLTDNNTYTGGTSVKSGELSLSGSGSLSGSTVTLAAGTRLDISGTTTGAAIGALAGSGNVVLGTKALTVGANNADTTYSGAISGEGSLTKTGTGVMALTGSNTYTGGTTISGGTLQLGDGDVLGSIVGDIKNNSALAFNRADEWTQVGVISGSGSVVQMGMGTLKLTDSHTCTGGTFVNAGTVAVNADTDLGNANGALTLSGGTLRLDNAAIDIARPVVLGQGGGTVNTNGGDATFSGSISGSGALTKAGAGTLTLTGNNTHTGNTSVNNGILKLQANHTVANGSTFTVTAGTTLDNQATLRNNGTITVAGTVTNGGVIKGGGTYDGANAFKTIVAHANRGVIDGGESQVYAEPAGTAAFDLGKLDVATRTGAVPRDGWFAAKTGGSALASPLSYEDGDTIYTQWAVVSAQGVSLGQTTLELKPTDERLLTAVLIPDDATNTAVTWKSSDESVATVDANGLVKAIGKGTATITVTTVEGGHTATCAVTVTPISYSVLSHFITFDGSGSRTATVDADVGKFVSLWNGNTPIDPAHVTVTGGSTVIALSEAYLKTLPNNTHTITAEFTDGTAILPLDVAVSASTGTSPKTGDEANMSLWIALCMIAGVAIVGVATYRRRKARQE